MEKLKIDSIINILNNMSKEANEIETDFLSVKGKSLIVSKKTISIKNISMISISDFKKIPFPKWNFVILIIAAIMFDYGNWFSIIFFAIFLFDLYIWYKRKERNKKLKTLNILLNSGNVYKIIFNDQEFLEDVLQKLTGIISEPGKEQNIIINISNNTFKDESSVIS